MSTEAEQDEATRRQAAINEALAVSDACWRMEQEVLQRQLAEWRSRAEYAERELSAALDLPPSIGPAEGEAKRIVETLRRERDEARVELKKTEDDFQSVFDSRDEVIRERGQYLDARNRHWFDLSRIAGICNSPDGETPFKAVERVVRERDELLQRVETLRELADRAAYEQGVAQRRMTEAQTARDNVAFRARRACQLLVEEVGADGPTDVDEVADRAAVLIRELRDQVNDLQAAAEESEHQMHLRVRAGYDKTIADCWRAKVAEVEAERDEARAEVEKLRRERDEQIAEAASWRATARDKGSSSRAAAKERDELRAENERLQRLLDHATQPNPGTSVLVMLMNEAREARAEVERLRAERDAFYEGQKGALAEFSRREVHQRAFNAAFDREIERGKTPAEAADIAGRVAYWDMRESEAKGTDR